MNRWMKFTTEIQYLNETISVSGSWMEGHSGRFSTFNDPLGEPPEPSDIEIDVILFKDVDIMEFIHSEYMSEIEDKTLEVLQEH